MLDTLYVELTVVLGKTRMPMQRALQLGRGAVVALDPTEGDMVEVLANGLPIAQGKLKVRDGAITVSLTSLVRRAETTRIPGSTIGGFLRLEGSAAEPDAFAEPAFAL